MWVFGYVPASGGGLAFAVQTGWAVNNAGPSPFTNPVTVAEITGGAPP
jgi:hypothetical protein